ncbi:MAG: gamma-glutamyltransferase, partial [Gammaproteobacteria bacterium]|nr:gamma-glutamyltransferase [Gammaproteobacteria bacterium]
MKLNARLQHLFVATLGAIFLFASISSLADGRIAVRGKNGIVASSSAIASEVGVQVMKDGGNVVDAAIATAFAMAVTWPSAGNIGGGGFMIYHGADGETAAFDFREKAPLAATADMYLDDEGNIRDNSNHDGLLAVGVPGTVAGLALAHERYGSKPWKDLVAPAVRLARDGIPVSWALYDDFSQLMPQFEKYPGTKKAFSRPDGNLYEPGDLWVQRDLADTLRRIQKDGHDGFYRGRTAKLIADFMAANGGIITLEDLAAYQAVEREPIRGDYRGYEIVSMPPPSSGGVVLVEMLN